MLRERDFRAVSEAIGRDAGVADVSGYTDYGRVWLEFLDKVVDDLDPRSTVIVLGDARQQHRDGRALGVSLTQHAVQLRNPYVDPLNYIQVEMLHRIRALPDQEGEEAQSIREVISITINGIAAGLRNTG